MALLRRRRNVPVQTGEQALDQQFRDLYTRVLLRIEYGGNLVLGISSALEGEGKTTIAIRLAGVLAGDRALSALGFGAGEILLLECNQGTPQVAQAFDVAETPGLVQYLAGACQLDEAIKRTHIPSLSVLPSGGLAPGFPTYIRTRMQDLLDVARERFALTIIDLPAVLNSTDTRVLAGLSDQLLLVVRAASTPSRFVTRTLDELGATSVLGIVLNDYRRDLPEWLDRRI
jgi:Mrp family chromosome partitioning ATPase